MFSTPTLLGDISRKTVWELKWALNQPSNLYFSVSLSKKIVKPSGRYLAIQLSLICMTLLVQLRLIFSANKANFFKNCLVWEVKQAGIFWQRFRPIDFSATLLSHNFLKFCCKERQTFCSSQLRPSLLTKFAKSLVLKLDVFNLSAISKLSSR